MGEDLFDIEFASDEGPLLVGLALGLLELVHELNQIIVAGVAINMFLMPLYQAVPDPVSLIQIAIVSKAVVAREGFVGLFTHQGLTGGCALDFCPGEKRSA